MKLTKRLRKLCLILFALISSSAVFSQEKTITGRIVDAGNLPLAGVTISVKGKNTATTTNDQGDFTIRAATGDVLQFSAVGFAPYQQTVGTASAINLTLAANTVNLNEVVVIGYGTTRKKDMTGAVTTISAKDFQGGVITTPEQLIAGKVAGVSIISNSGRPGDGSSILIRGGSSLSASNSPLYVIDGVPLDNGNISGASNPLSFINPNDIESFNVLKDASAAAIYGTRASNGVILITTKRGKSGQMRATFTTVNSIATIRNKVDVLSADQFRAIVNTNGTPAQKAMLGGSNTDWQDEIYQAAFATDNNISISGGVKNLPYRLSTGQQLSHKVHEQSYDENYKL